MPGVHIQSIQIRMSEIIWVPSPNLILVHRNIEVVDTSGQSGQLIDGGDLDGKVLVIRISQGRI